MAIAVLLACAPVVQPVSSTEAVSGTVSGSVPGIVSSAVSEQELRLRQAELLAREQQTQASLIRYLLSSAEQALQGDRLMVPKPDNAFDWYQQVLAIDEANADAHKGMRRITARYMRLAREAFEQGLAEKGERMLWGASQVSATPRQVQLLREEFRERLASRPPALAVDELAARSEKIQHMLAELAARARDENLRLLIVARNDAEGRWIYRTMRDAVAGYRLRGNIEIGVVPRVELIDL